MYLSYIWLWRIRNFDVHFRFNGCIRCQRNHRSDKKDDTRTDPGLFTFPCYGLQGRTLSMQQPNSQAEFAVLIWSMVDKSAEQLHSGSVGTPTSKTHGVRVRLLLPFQRAFSCLTWLCPISRFPLPTLAVPKVTGPSSHASRLPQWVISPTRWRRSRLRDNGRTLDLWDAVGSLEGTGTFAV